VATFIQSLHSVSELLNFHPELISRVFDSLTTEERQELTKYVEHSALLAVPCLHEVLAFLGCCFTASAESERRREAKRRLKLQCRSSSLVLCP